MKQTILLYIPKDFNFWTTVWSSGWSVLEPFGVDKEGKVLSRVQKLSSGTIVRAAVTQSQKGKLAILAESHRRMKKSDIEELKNALKACLRLEEDLSPFYSLLEDYQEFGWAEEFGAGRSIRSPTVFEDVVKTICTTNASWSLTKAATRRICSKIGDGFSDEFYTFPTPQQIASKNEEFMRKEIKIGYRSPYLIELAQKVSTGKLDVESWRSSSLDSTDLKAEITKIKGVGNYAADNILKLLGRYDFLALDSWVRKRFAELHKKGKAASDKEIEEFYAPFGEWKGLVLALDLTKEWLIPKDKKT
ncbi:MAG: DNA-3-methyladenine glycosylase family protein [Candidatus Hodarchaeota archaeon]